MKFAAAYYLLLIYTTVVLQPVIPFCEDALCHCFAEAYHIETVHAKYGNDHLEKQIANEAGTNSNKNVLKEDNFIAVHLPATSDLESAPINSYGKMFIIQYCFYAGKIFINVIIPPPKPFRII